MVSDGYRSRATQTPPPILDVQDTPTSKKSAPSIQKAVALSYERGVDDAPRIVATGKGAIAEQILQLAFAHGVKVRKDEDLIEVLAKLDVDSVIPLEAFAAVAEILAYVYRANAMYGHMKQSPSSSS
jgi:flagellar biosynthesis protein